MAVATKSGIYNGYKVIGTQTLGLRGLVLWLKFNEGSGNIAYDSSFYNNHGTIYGATWTDGKFGKALSFDGVDDWVKVADSESLNPKRITITAWVKRDTTGVSHSIVGKFRFASNTSYYLIIRAMDTVEFIIGDGANRYALNGNTIIDTNWHFIAATYDGACMKIWIDGELDNSLSVTTNIASNTQPVTIGTWNPTAADPAHFNGTIDEVRIYNRALSENEIKMLYYNRIGAVPSKTI